MAISRQKKAQKTLSFYKNNYKFRAPFQVLLDGTFALAALKAKFNIKEQITKYFQEEVKLLTTQCLILETENLAKIDKGLNGALNIIKQFPFHKCGHEKNPISGPKCFISMVENNNSTRYIIASQDRELQDKVRKLAGVPLLYLHGNTPTLERPSEVTLKHAEKLRNACVSNTWQMQNLEKMKELANIEEEDVKPKKRRKKGGPNPLSCKKKKKKPIVNQPSAKTGKVKKRKRKIKIAAHIMEAFKAQASNKP